MWQTIALTRCSSSSFISFIHISAHIDILFFNSAILFAVPHDESSMVAHHKQLGGRKSHCNLLGWGVVRVRVIMPIIAVLQFVQFRHLFSMMNSKQHITPLPSVAPFTTDQDDARTLHSTISRSDDNKHILRSTSTSVTPPSYMKLPLPDSSLPPVSIGACCGMEHRLARNIPTIVYAIGNSRLLVHLKWDDVLWNTIFDEQ